VIDRPAPRRSSLRLLADQAFSRTAGAPLIGGNAVRLLIDAAENFPAWLAAIESAEHTIFFENYIFGGRCDGPEFRDALAGRARPESASECFTTGWAVGKIVPGFWRPLTSRGASVRAFNTPSFVSPLGWLSARSSKVDLRRRASSVCLRSCAPPERGTAIRKRQGALARHGHRDPRTGVSEVERAFAQAWAATGSTIPENALTDPPRSPRG
jgi:cardiolipin synthase